jgi:hypothetical protein
MEPNVFYVFNFIYRNPSSLLHYLLSSPTLLPIYLTFPSTSMNRLVALPKVSDFLRYSMSRVMGIEFSTPILNINNKLQYILIGLIGEFGESIDDKV